MSAVPLGRIRAAYGRLPEDVRRCLRPLNLVDEAASFLPARLRAPASTGAEMVRRLADFLAVLPSEVESAFEFRHPSWFGDATLEALAARGAALCIADSDELTTPFAATAPFGYLRLRRTEYDASALADWARRVRSTRWRRAYVYLKHEDAGRGPALARTLLDLFD